VKKSLDLPKTGILQTSILSLTVMPAQE